MAATGGGPRRRSVDELVVLPDGRTGLALWVSETDDLDVVPIQDISAGVGALNRVEHVLVQADGVHPQPPRTAVRDGEILTYEWVPSVFRTCSGCGSEVGVFAFNTGAEERQPGGQSAASEHFCTLCALAPS